MSQLRIIDATSAGYLMGEVDLGLEYSNFDG